MYSVHSFIEETTAERISLLQALIRVPSDNPPGDCQAHADMCAGLIEELGFKVEKYSVPESVCEANGLKSITNLIVRHRFGPGPTVALNAHGDVVPPGSGWSVDPYGGEIQNGWIYGRGAAVSKSDFVTYAYALKALIASGQTLGGAVELHFTYDEETGGNTGPRWLLDNGLTHPDYAVCAAFSYQVITAHNGCLHLKVTLHGRSAHAAWAETGVDAIEAATHLLNALYTYRDGLKDLHSDYSGVTHPSLVVGCIQGGINTNVVPDQVSLNLDRRIIPEEDPAVVEQELRELITEVLHATPGISVSIDRILLASPFTPTPASQAFAERISTRASAILGQPVGCGAVPLYTDARHYSEAGIPTVMYGAGPLNPLDANGHRADERVPLDTLTSTAKIIADVLVELLNGELPG